MAKLLALLRGINVGGNKKVPMSDLRALAEELGLLEVATYINSGNLVARSAETAEATARKLEEAIAKRFGFEVTVVARTASQWKKHVAANPFAAASRTEPERVILHVSKEPPAPTAVARLAERARDGEKVVVAGGALWIHYPEGQGRSKLAPGLIDRLVGSPTTARNWRTVLVLSDMLG
ncbi:MAG: DUF1697 domain-containing protein [Planctomycetota bacterium]